jgi:CHAT domain-containing protein
MHDREASMTARPDGKTIAWAVAVKRAFLVVLVAAVVVAIISISMWDRDRTVGLGALVRASESEGVRSGIGRLGGFPYRRLTSAPTRSAHAMASSISMLSSVSRVMAATDGLETSEAAHVRGISSLLVRDVSTAIASLEEAVRLDSNRPELASAIRATANARLLSDLSAAYLERSGDAASDLAALNAAVRAWELSKSPESGWNRAVAFSRTGPPGLAANAWREFIATDSRSPWIAEAQERLAAVTSDVPGSSESRTAIERAVASGRREDLVDAVTLAPGVARVLAEDTLLPAWGRGDETALENAKKIGEVLRVVSSDALVRDTVIAIESLSAPEKRHVREAMSLYGRGREELAAYRYEPAARDLSEADSVLEQYQIPLSGRIGVYRATLAYYGKQHVDALAICERALKRYGARYRTIAAQCAWNAGTVETAQREYDKARSSFELARRLFVEMRDRSAAAALDVRLAENFRWAGNLSEACSSATNALRAGSADREHIALNEIARIAASFEYPFAALAFSSAASEAASRARVMAGVTDAHLGRAHVLMDLGRIDEARRELEAAARARASIGDAIAASRFNAPIAVARASIEADLAPDSVLPELAAAVADSSSSNVRRNLAPALTLMARAHLAKRDFAEAERSLQRALEELDRQRTEIITDEERLVFVDACRKTTETLVDLLDQIGRDREALQAAEESKAKLLRDSLAELRHPGVPIAARFRLPEPAADDAYVEYFALPDRLLVWTITRSGLRCHRIRVSRPELGRLADSLLIAASAGREIGPSASAVFNLLLAPVWDELRGARQIAIVADDAISRVPFAILRDPGTRRFLGEDYLLKSEPSLSWLNDSMMRSTLDARTSHALVIAPSTPSAAAAGMPRLAATEEEARFIAARIPHTTVLAGDDATAANVIPNVAGAGLIHFAGHATLNERRPALSALILSRDVPLTAAEIGRWRLADVRLVVLAACSTSAGPATSDGTASVARAFVLAGAPSVIATLRPVSDVQAARFSRVFYDVLASGRNGAEAFQEAQRTLLRAATGNDYDWAFFQWIGK